MLQPLVTFTTMLANPIVLFAIMALSFICKLSILFLCIKYVSKDPANRLLFFLFVLFLTAALFDDTCHIISFYVRKIIVIKGPIQWLTFLNRIGWAFFMTQYQAIAFFLEYLTTKKIKFGFLNTFTCIVNALISCSFLYLAFFKYYPIVDPGSKEIITFFEIKLTQIAYIYLPFLFAPKFYALYKKIQNQEIPTILSHQLRYLTSFFIPYLLLETVNSPYSYLGYFFSLAMNGTYFSIHFFFPLTTMLCTYAIYFVSKKMMGLRFLNIKKNVESKEKFNFLSQFKDILEQLSYATALKELAHLTQTFFQSAFAIPLGRTRLYVRKETQEKDDYGSFDVFNIGEKVEYFIGKQENQKILQELKNSKIFIRDEIHFSYFYEEDNNNKEILEFLESINADIFLPIYERNTITSYVIVELNSRPQKLFTNKERDEMLVFTSYLSNIINILKYSNIEILHQRHKQLTEEVYLKHQEINQYKESIRSFMRSSKGRKIGIVFYKNRRFSMANDAAQELIAIDINVTLGHSLTQAFKTIAQKVQDYKTSQSLITRDVQGQRIVIAGIPSLEENATILLIYYPEISDIIKSQFDQLKDPSAWDYLLYLETTQSGQLINQLIPSNNEKLLTFKINLLATALSKKATLLQIPENDLAEMVQILHSISLRQTLHKAKLIGPEKNNDVMLTLFGLNPLMQKDEMPPLLEKLDTVGTLFIENIEYLSIETQNALAHYITHGFFYKYKSEHKIFSSVRIICSTYKNLLELTHEGAFSKALFNELQKTHLTMPSLLSLTENEINQLAHEYVEQITSKETFKNLLTLSEKDKMRLSTDRPLSLREFREKVHQLLMLKSSKNNLAEITEFNPAYNLADPDMAQAVRLGKKALKDPQIMALLWSKLKNQNKIATLLGVNRSSVNRRCIEFNLK
ncbi:sigma 54-interacting transcriptional regulator [Candidatus Dependentiae bacterium]|nr:sigma 54-interacting transcriptional regulator [Candidatus Dependentiae bacterium]